MIANKIDLPEKNVTSYNMKQFQKENKVEIFECSAKSGKNTSEAFEYIIKEIVKGKKEKEGDKVKIDTFENADRNNCAC